MNPAKRRRLDATASALSKPFRSPLRVTSSNRQSTVEIAKTDYADNQATTPVKSEHNKAVPSKLATWNPSRELEGEQDITKLQKEYAALSQQLRKLRQDFDVVEQARQLRAAGREEKLNKAILKWRDVARDAADEVFESASKRVNDMGGLQAWQKNTLAASSQNRLSDWFDDKEQQPSSDAVEGFGDDITGGLQSDSLAADEAAGEAEEEVTSLLCIQTLSAPANRSVAVFYYGRNASTAQRRPRSSRL